MKDVNYKNKTHCQWQGLYFFCSGHYKEITDLPTVGWPLQFSGTFCNILKSHIIINLIQKWNTENKVYCLLRGTVTLKHSNISICGLR